MMMANCKRLKVERELKTIKVNADIISNLPEGILHHIVSFLPTRCAVSTCILSKRWEHVWKTTTKLEFSLETKEQIYEFPFFVDQVLRYHSSNITNFAFYFHKISSCYLDPSIVMSCISAAVNRKVQEVLFSNYSSLALPLPLSLCNSNMLTVLKLTSHCGHLKLPSKVCFSSLKILHLKNVNFSDRLSFNKLFSGLPNIEELKLDYCDCDWNYIKDATISLPTLRCLSLHICGFDNNQASFIKVNAENLVYLDYRGTLHIDLFLDKMPSLSEVDVYIFSRFLRRRKADRAVYLFAAIRYAKSLKIDADSLQVLHSLKSQGNLNFFPTFINLTALKIYSRVTSDDVASMLIDILQSAPILESVVIQEVYGGKWSRKPYYPQCIQWSLRKCSILHFGGRQADMLFVKFVLKAARVLEKLELCCTQSLCRRQKKLKDIMNELQILRRASKRCVIEFDRSAGNC